MIEKEQRSIIRRQKATSMNNVLTSQKIWWDKKFRQTSQRIVQHATYRNSSSIIKTHQESEYNTKIRQHSTYRNSAPFITAVSILSQVMCKWSLIERRADEWKENNVIVRLTIDWVERRVLSSLNVFFLLSCWSDCALLEMNESTLIRIKFSW